MEGRESANNRTVTGRTERELHPTTGGKEKTIG